MPISLFFWHNHFHVIEIENIRGCSDTEECETVLLYLDEIHCYKCIKKSERHYGCKQVYIVNCIATARMVDFLIAHFAHLEIYFIKWFALNRLQPIV